jgi:hypothetical protein
MRRSTRQLKELRALAKRLKPGAVPGALLDSTTGGTFLRPLGRSRVRSGDGGGIARYH